jgi:hypothetical protein
MMRSISVYSLGSRIVLVTMFEDWNGIWRAVRPIETFDYGDQERLGATILTALNRRPPLLRTPHWAQPREILIAGEIKSWRELAEVWRSAYITLSRKEAVVTPYISAGEGQSYALEPCHEAATRLLRPFSEVELGRVVLSALVQRPST